MKCPYRKQIIHKTADCSHYASDNEEFMECYGEKCPHYHTSKYPNGDVVNECKKVESEYYHATHLGGKQEECHSQSYDNGFDAGYKFGKEDAQKHITGLNERIEFLMQQIRLWQKQDKCSVDCEENMNEREADNEC